AVLVAVYLLTLFWHSAISVEQLVQKALTANEESQRIQAAQELSRLGEEGLLGMRQVFNESDNTVVIAISLLGLSRQRDYQCMDLIIDKLDDSEETVRAAAAKAVTCLLGRDYGFPVRGKVSEWTEYKKRIHNDWEQYRGSELFEFNLQRVSSSR
ncbi:MAG: hypothetical protein VX438_01445, partial [Planctomycetota bacterium]|nr:hypothetical protein [Planctomycetota bacterium]